MDNPFLHSFDNMTSRQMRLKFFDLCKKCTDEELILLKQALKIKSGPVLSKELDESIRLGLLTQ